MILNTAYIVEETKRKDNEMKRAKQQWLHGDAPFNPAQVKDKTKYEYPFLGLDEIYTYSFLL